MYSQTLIMITLIKKELWRDWATKHFTLLPEIGTIITIAIVLKVIPIPQNYSINNQDFFTFISYGLITTSLISNSFAATAFNLVHAKMENYILDYMLIPLTRLRTYISISLTAVFTAVISALIVAITLSLFGFQPPSLTKIITIAGILFITGINFTLLGIIAGIYSRDWDSIGAKFSLILIPFIFLSGVFYPIENIKPSFHFLFEFNPVYQIINGTRRIAETSIIPTETIIALLALTSITLTGAYLLLRNRHYDNSII